MRMLLPAVSHFLLMCSKEIYHDVVKGEVFIVLKRESGLEVGNQEDSMAGDRSDHKKGTVRE